MKILYFTDICIFVAFGAFVAIHEPCSTHYLFGLGIAVAGIALSIVARIQLGRSFSIRARATRLVTTRPLFQIPASHLFLSRDSLPRFVYRLGQTHSVNMLFSYLLVSNPAGEKGRQDPGGRLWRRISPLQSRTWF